MCDGGDFSERDGAVRVRPVDSAVVSQGHILSGAVQEGRSDDKQLLAGFDGDCVDGGCADGDASAGAGAVAGGDEGGITVDDVHICGGEGELIGDELGDDGLGALAVGRDAGEYGDAAGRLDEKPSVAGTPCASGASALDDGGDADAGEGTALGSVTAGLLFPGVVAGEVQGAVEDGPEVTGVVHDVDGGVVGEGVSRDEVPAPDVGGVQSELGRDYVNSALEAEGGLGAAGATVGAVGGLVGDDAEDLDVQGGGLVRADHMMAGVEGSGGGVE